MSAKTIYILKLVRGKFYVGKSNDPVKRFQSHLNGTGSVWTRIHKPLGIEKVILCTSPFEEDRYTKEYMHLYGIDNVRGGSYSNLILDKSQIDSISREIWWATDKCAKCGSVSHFVSDCPEII